jgi:hypothetical protein
VVALAPHPSSGIQGARLRHSQIAGELWPLLWIIVLLDLWISWIKTSLIHV